MILHKTYDSANVVSKNVQTYNYILSAPLLVYSLLNTHIR